LILNTVYYLYGLIGSICYQFNSSLSLSRSTQPCLIAKTAAWVRSHILGLLMIVLWGKVL